MLFFFLDLKYTRRDPINAIATLFLMWLEKQELKKIVTVAYELEPGSQS